MRDKDAPWPRRPSDGHALIAQVGDRLGSKQWWRLTVGPDGYTWERADLDSRIWVTQTISTTHSTFLEAIAANASVHAGAGRFVEMHVDESRLQGLAATIAPPGLSQEDGVDWPPDVVERWTKYRDYLTVDIPHKEVWTEVNGATLLIYTPDGTTDEWPVLYSWDEDRFLGLEVLGESSWFAEADGAPVSWNGASRLSRLFPGMLLSEAWGDDRSESELVPVSTDGEVALAIARFILQDSQQVLAAWRLEEFGADSPDRASDRAEWQSVMDELAMDLTLHFDSAEQERQCRKALRGNSGYARVAAAIRDPESEDGRDLLALLRSVAANGTTGDIMGENL